MVLEIVLSGDMCPHQEPETATWEHSETSTLLRDFFLSLGLMHPFPVNGAGCLIHISRREAKDVPFELVKHQQLL